MEETKKVRNSNLELLRIVSMILIILHHYSIHNFKALSGFSINNSIIQSLAIGGKIGVNCFVLITGYFMINSKFKGKKLLKLWIQVLTYSITICIIAISLGVNVGIKDIITSIFPVIYSQYWFITTYIVMYIFSDYINELINKFSQKNLKKLILLLIIIQVIIPTFTAGDFQFSNVLWFITLYIIGAYIRKYSNEYFDNTKYNLIAFGVSIIIMIAWIIFVEIIGQRFDFINKYYTYFTKANSLFIVVSSISLFIIFKNINIRGSKIINVWASAMLGVYLIHDNMLLRKIIWNNIFNVKQLEFEQNTLILIINIVLITLAILITCSIIDLIRQKLIEPVQIKIADKILNLIIKRLYKNKFVKNFIGIDGNNSEIIEKL